MQNLRKKAWTKLLCAVLAANVVVSAGAEAPPQWEQHLGIPPVAVDTTQSADVTDTANAIDTADAIDTSDVTDTSDTSDTSDVTDTAEAVVQPMAASAGGNRLTVTRTPQEIAAAYKKYNQDKPTVNYYDANSQFVTKPRVTAPYAAGSLTAGYLQTAVDRLNFYRYLGGLDEVVPNADLNDLGQHGAVICAALDQLNHRPPQPTDMNTTFYNRAYAATTSANLSSGSHYEPNMNYLTWGIDNCMEDTDIYNIEVLGHRRWFLNPTLKQFGAGHAATTTGYRYSSYQVFDKSGTAPAYDFIAWPPVGAFPYQSFSSGHAWSVTLNPDLYSKPDKASVTVTLTRASDKKTWKLSQTDYASGSNLKSSGYSVAQPYFNVETTGYGIPNCIIFYPNDSTVGSQAGKYTVEIAGLTNKSGSATTVTYDVEFFDINNPPVVPTLEKDGLSYSVNGNGAVVNSVNSVNSDGTGNVVVPSTVTNNGVEYPVTTIGANAFAAEGKVDSVAIPSTITTIGAKALAGVDTVVCFGENAAVAADAFQSGATVYAYESSDIYKNRDEYAGVKIEPIADKPVFSKIEKDGKIEVLHINPKKDIPQDMITISVNNTGSTLQLSAVQNLEMEPQSAKVVPTGMGTGARVFVLDKVTFKPIWLN